MDHFEGFFGLFEGIFWSFFLTFLVLMLQKGYLDQIGVIGAIVNLPTLKRRILKGFKGRFEGIFGPLL